MHTTQRSVVIAATSRGFASSATLTRAASPMMPPRPTWSCSGEGGGLSRFAAAEEPWLRSGWSGAQACGGLSTWRGALRVHPSGAGVATSIVSSTFPARRQASSEREFIRTQAVDGRAAAKLGLPAGSISANCALRSTTQSSEHGIFSAESKRIVCSWTVSVRMNAARTDR